MLVLCKHLWDMHGSNGKKKDRVFCLCAQSPENKKVKKCVNEVRLLWLIEYSKKTSKLLFFFNPFCLPCSAASNLFRIDNKLFYQKKCSLKYKALS